MSLDKKYEGVDSDLLTSLEEYGFVARPITVDYDDEYFVIYKIDKNQYGSGHVRESELDAIVNGTEWASEEDVDSMLETTGSSKEEWMNLSFISKLSDLISYWGTENVIGTDYYPNDKKWAFEEVGLDDEEDDDEEDDDEFAKGGEISVKELNLNHQYTYEIDEDNNGSIYKESGVYFVQGFENGKHFSKTFEDFKEAKNYYLSKSNKKIENKPEYYIFEGVDNLNGNPLYRVESSSESDNEYVGEWHTDKIDAEKELKSFYADGGEIITLWKIPVENQTYNVLKPILLKKGTKRVINKFLSENINNKDIYDGRSGVQEWLENTTAEEVEEYNKKSFSNGGGVDNGLALVNVKFKDPEYNYMTNVSGNLSKEEAEKYFIGKQFNLGTYPKEDFQTVIDIDFYPKGTWQEADFEM